MSLTNLILGKSSLQRVYESDKQKEVSFWITLSIILGQNED